jgi:hypothetical protein
VNADTIQISTFQTVNGCDSIIVTNVTVNPVYYLTENVIACENSTYTYPDGTTAVITASTSYSSVFTTVSGCDSIIGTNVTMSLPFNSTENITACENSTVTYPDGSTEVITVTTTHTSTLLTTNNCDSIIITNVTMLPVYAIAENVTACENSTYTYPDGSTAVITADATYTSALTTLAGCDSIITTNVTMNSITAGTDVLTACGMYTWIDGTVYTQSNNTAMFTLVNANGCDSVVTLDLTINVVDVTVTSNQFTLTANASGAVYLWLDCNNNFAAMAGETAQTFTATANGDYAVLVTENNCSDTSACVNVTGFGVGDIALNNAISIYPNPTTSEFTIDFKGNAAPATITIRNLLGEVILEEQVSGDQVNMSLAGKQRGVYMVTISNEFGVAVQRIVLQ